MKTAVIIPAAGSGTRFGESIPKALINLAGLPMVRWSAKAFCGIKQITSIIVLTPDGYETEFSTALENLDIVPIISRGGSTRAESVRIGMSLLPDDCKLVAIHDAARPLITTEDIRAVLEVAETTGAATLAHPVSDTLKTVEEKIILDTVDRSRLWAVQTPQVFHRDIYAKALQSSFSETATDDCALVEQSGHSVRVVPGSRINFKVTYPEDKIIVEAILKQLPKGFTCE